MTDTPTETKPCPHCAERIRPGAIVCRFCGRPTSTQTKPRPYPTPESMLALRVTILGLALALAIPCSAVGSSASLSDTEEFLTNHGVTVGFIQGPGFVVMMSVNFAVRDCIATVTTTATSDGQTDGPNTKRMRRGQLSDVRVSSSSAAARFSPDHEVGLSYTSPGVLTPRLLVGYYDADTAERIARALHHWLRLCGKPKEPF